MEAINGTNVRVDPYRKRIQKFLKDQQRKQIRNSIYLVLPYTIDHIYLGSQYKIKVLFFFRGRGWVATQKKKKK